MKKTILKTLITTFIISAMLGILIVFLDFWNDITGKIVFSTIIIFGFSVPGLCCATNHEKTKDKTISTIGIVICFISCIYFLLLIWELFDFEFLDSINWKFILSGILLSSSFGHICLLLLINSEDKIVYYFKKGTIVLSVLLDLILLLQIYAETIIIWKLQLVFAILIVMGTIVTPLLNKLTNQKTSIVKKEFEEDKYKKIEQLKSLLDNNAITKEEYDTEKSKILNS